MFQSFRPVLRPLLNAGLASAFALAPLSAEANRGLASIRQPPPKKASEAVRLSARDIARLNRAMIDRLVERYERSRSQKGFDQEFLSLLNPRDREEMRASFADMKEWPTARRVQDKIVFEQNGEKLVVQIPNVLRPTILVDGMSWTFNTRQPLAYQVRLALKNFDYLRSQKSSLFRWILPEASAQDAAAAASGSGVLDKAAFLGEAASTAPKTSILRSAVGSVLRAPGTFLKSTGVGIAAAIVTTEGLPVAEKFICGRFVAGTSLETEYDFCHDWRKNQIDGMKMRTENLGHVDAMDTTKIAAEDKETLKWVANHDHVACDVMNQKGKGLYVVDFLQVKRSGDAWVPDGGWVSVVQKYKPDGKPDQFFITAKGTDTSDPKWQDKAINVLNFDNGSLTSIMYKNPHRDPADPASPVLLKQDVNAMTERPSAVHDTTTDEQVERQHIMTALIRGVNKLASMCRDDAFTDSLEKDNVQVTKDTPSPQLDPATALPSADAPPATVPNGLSH